MIPRAILTRFLAPWRDGLLLWRLAPWIPLIVVMPELIQHAIEWKLGMFAGLDAFKAHQTGVLRLAFGIPKQLLYFVAAFAAARYWFPARGPVLWRRLGLAMVLMAASALAPMPLSGHVPDSMVEVLGFLLLVPFVVLLVMVTGAALGDSAMTLKQTFIDGWRKLPLLIAVPALPMATGQWVHRQNHYLAMGKPGWIIAALMIWDALWVGCLACWTGAALAQGYGQPLAKR